MAYVSVTGGREAIHEASKLIHHYRLQGSNESIGVDVIEKQLRLLVDRICSEGGMYAPEHAALALKQAEGDPSEAAFLVRAYRSTLPRNHYSLTMEPAQMRVIRHISSSFRDMPGGQVLGPTYDYTHRLLNFDLRHEGSDELARFAAQYAETTRSVGTSGGEDKTAEGVNDHAGDHDDVPLTFRKVTDLLREQGLMPPIPEEASGDAVPFDLTRQKLTVPTVRSARLQALARGETGAMTALAYSSMRGYGVVHPTIGELRVGYCSVCIPHPYANDDDGVYIGEIMLTEVETINSFTQNKSGDVHFVLGYGLCFGQNEVKAISMAILERSLETKGTAPAQDEEFVLLHIDNVESSGFVSHLKLPHYITFQSSLERIRSVQERSRQTRKEEPTDA